MEAKNFLFKSGHGKQTTLDKAYYKHIHCILDTLDEESEIRWETYNLIIELITCENHDYFSEIKYRITDGENPNDVILDIIERNIDNSDSLIWFLKRRVEEYREEDFFKRFID
jgi:hypothetical protein